MGERILIWILIVPPFLALTLFELITGPIERNWDYYRFWESKRAGASTTGDAGSGVER